LLFERRDRSAPGGKNGGNSASLLASPLGARGAGILGRTNGAPQQENQAFYDPMRDQAESSPKGRFPSTHEDVRPPRASFSGQIQSDGTMFRRVRDVASGRRLSRLLRLSHRKAFPSWPAAQNRTRHRPAQWLSLSPTDVCIYFAPNAEQMLCGRRPSLLRTDLKLRPKCAPVLCPAPSWPTPDSASVSAKPRRCRSTSRARAESATDAIDRCRKRYRFARNADPLT
jgi:hypothetical protein